MNLYRCKNSIVPLFCRVMSDMNSKIHDRYKPSQVREVSVCQCVELWVCIGKREPENPLRFNVKITK